VCTFTRAVYSQQGLIGVEATKLIKINYLKIIRNGETALLQNRPRRNVTAALVTINALFHLPKLARSSPHKINNVEAKLLSNNAVALQPEGVEDIQEAVGWANKFKQNFPSLLAHTAGTVFTLMPLPSICASIFQLCGST
jgi:hypothetical protein